LRLKGFVFEKFNIESVPAFISNRSSNIFSLAPWGRYVVCEKEAMGKKNNKKNRVLKSPFRDLG
jgi:hypothetical protein